MFSFDDVIMGLNLVNHFIGDTPAFTSNGTQKDHIQQDETRRAIYNAMKVEKTPSRRCCKYWEWKSSC